MPEQHLFEYAVLRIMPRVDREEFMNIGVVAYCARQKYLQVIYEINENRWKAFCPQLDLVEVNAYLQAFERICKGGKDAGPIGQLPIAERFRWLTATRSTVVQTSRVHPGLCNDEAAMLQRLYHQMVL